MSNELKAEELERYKRQISVDGFGKDAQQRLKNSSVLVAGIGGLGGVAAMYLAAAGIGRLALIHEGHLETADLNRQTLMSADGIGKSRVIQAKEAIKNFNPHIEIDIFDEPIKPERLKAIMPDVDMVIDARHNFPERRMLNSACIETGKPMIEAAMNGMEGYLFAVIPDETACLNCLYPEDPDWDPYGFPVLGAVAGTVGCLAAIEGIKILTGFKVGADLKSVPTLLYCDLGSMEFKRFKTYRREECKICGHLSLRDTHVSAKMQASDSAESISL